MGETPNKTKKSTGSQPDFLIPCQHHNLARLHSATNSKVTEDNERAEMVSHV